MPMVAAFEKASGKKVPYQTAETELGWKAKYNINDIGGRGQGAAVAGVPGLLAAEGHTAVLRLEEAEQEFVFEHVASEPVVFREAELTNGRWAMAAVAGILFTDLVGLPKWYDAGAEKYALSNQTLLVIELVVFAFLEAKRYEGYKKTGGTGVAFWFPFDPLGMRSKDMELKELKNGRL
ncbi:chlorophyll a-b binding protein, chloroplastic, partial [Haematococcus lacustris]